jgi:hypothetical protein
MITIYTNEEMVHENILARLKELPNDELAAMADKLTEYYTIITVVELNVKRVSPDVAHRFADLCASLNGTQPTMPRHSVQTGSNSLKIVRQATKEELLSALASNEYSRMWAENDREKKAAEEADHPDAEVVK